MASVGLRVLVAGLAVFAAMPAAATSSSELPPARAVAEFAQARSGAPLWLREGPDGPAVRALVATLRQAEADGFSAGPRLAAAADQAVQRVRGGREADRTEAERLLSGAWVMYVQALHWPASGMIYADPVLTPAIPAAATILADLAAAPVLADYVERVSAVNPLYAGLRAAWRAETDPEVRRTIRANLDRARALPASGRHILVDLASQKLWMMEGDRPVGSMQVVVGKAEMPTPLIAGTITAATLNPYWNVPADLVRRNIAPAVLRGGEGWLRQKNYELLSGWGADARRISAAAVNWTDVAEGRADVRIRQRPGSGNMMGAMKFEFAPRHGIYLHDTPDKALFANATRTFSSGCIRLEDAQRLGRWLLGRAPVANGAAPEQTVALAQAMPVYVTYFTARVDNGRLSLVPDIYGLDRAPSRLAAR